MIATAFFTGVVCNKLTIISKDEGGKYLSVLVKVKKPHRNASFFYLEAFNAEALDFKQKVRMGDFVSIFAEPYSNLKTDPKETKTKYSQGYKIVLFEVLKKGEIA